MARSADSAFLGQPIGLGWLSAAEFWERFSYYGMQALLVLYMTHTLLLPGHVEHVQGFAPFRRAIEGVYGPLSPQALASAIFGLYAGLVYLTPLAGGLLADRVLGRTRTVVLGASLMTLGHFLMAFDTSFLLALLFLVVGVGCFKGNIASQVGDLYAQDDPRRGNAFQIFLLVTQISGILTPLVCGTLGEVFGWHWGFAAAGIGMMFGLSAYLFGRYALPQQPRLNRDDDVSARPKLTVSHWRNIIILVALLPVLALGMVGNNEIFNAYMVWAERTYNLVFFGWTMPVTWLQSFANLSSAVTIVASVVFWRWWRIRRREPDELTKMAFGTIVCMLAPLALALAALLHARTGQRVSLGWGVLFQVVNDLGFANIIPIGQALYTRAAPKSLTGLMIGIYYTHLFIANMLVGELGGLLDRMSGVSFWLLHAGLMAVSAAILLVVRVTVGRTLAPAYVAPATTVPDIRQEK
ncbi:MAG: oligopeptide:H+ symporter [Caulobacteraceae bacterium]